MAGKIRQIREALQACFDANPEPLTKAQVFAWIGAHYPQAEFNTNTLQAQLYRSCDNTISAPGSSAPKIIHFDKSTKTYSRLPGDFVYVKPEAPFVESESDDDLEIESTFALEAHLRDYLARNLQILEKGLQLWETSPPSVEYMIDGRRIDLLAKDVDGVPVVIELKLNKSYDRVVGQALLYQGLISHQLKREDVRIMLVAGDVSKELKIACSRVSNVKLFEYAITMQVKQVSAMDEEGS